MKLLLPLLFVFLSFAGYSQKTDTVPCYFNARLQPVPRNEAFYQGVAVKSANRFTAIIYYKPGKLAARISFEDKKLTFKDGPCITYDTAGNLLETLNFLDNQLHGPAIRWYANNQKADSILYENGLKHGPCKGWYENGTTEYTGTHTMNGKSGAWTWFHPNGQQSSKEAYNEGKITHLECFDTKGQPQGFLCSVEKDCFLLGEIPDLKSYIIEHLEWPKDAFDKGMNGEVKIRFEVNELGKIRNFTVVQSSHALFTEEVKKVFEAMPNWSPAVSHNRPIARKWEMNIPFVQK